MKKDYRCKTQLESSMTVRSSEVNGWTTVTSKTGMEFYEFICPPPGWHSNFRVNDHDLPPGKVEVSSYHSRIGIAKRMRTINEEVETTLPLGWSMKK
ncbi:MAG: hypothetical protein P8R38_07850 [Planctomycetota bacterium]|nr:hypothetical protein [Planctomycetota bacterium]MDG2085378.1 hypothetical protein [Planctomycetota bacterium]